MGRIILAVRAFWGVVTGSIPAEVIRASLSGKDAAAEPMPTLPASPTERPVRPPERTRSKRNDAITLLAALQREARFVDLVQEPLQDYSDAQIGAAARDVLRDCRGVLNRLFAVQSVCDAEENSDIETPANASSGRWRVTGKVQGGPPFRGRLVHHGWQAARCELPQWSGGDDALMVIAPAEVEVGG